MAELERLESRLVALGAEIEFPSEPDLRRSVRSRLEPARPWLRWALAAAAVVLLAASVLTYSAPARVAVAGWLGLRGVTVQRVHRLPTPTASPDAGPLCSQQQAAAELGRPVLQPSLLGPPAGVHCLQAGRGTAAALTYTNPELLIVEANGLVDGNSFGKMVGPGTTLAPVTVNGQNGFWITGAPHGFFFYRDGGTDNFRLSGDVLIWNRPDGLVIRIEGAPSEQRALQIAASLR